VSKVGWMEEGDEGVEQRLNALPNVDHYLCSQWYHSWWESWYVGSACCSPVKADQVPHSAIADLKPSFTNFGASEDGEL
jgi:hypothetical protein